MKSTIPDKAMRSKHIMESQILLDTYVLRVGSRHPEVPPNTLAQTSDDGTMLVRAGWSSLYSSKSNSPANINSSNLTRCYLPAKTKTKNPQKVKTRSPSLIQAV